MSLVAPRSGVLQILVFFFAKLNAPQLPVLRSNCGFGRGTDDKCQSTTAIACWLGSEEACERQRGEGKTAARFFFFLWSPTAGLTRPLLAPRPTPKHPGLTPPTHIPSYPRPVTRIGPDSFTPIFRPFQEPKTASAFSWRGGTSEFHLQPAWLDSRLGLMRMLVYIDSCSFHCRPS